MFAGCISFSLNVEDPVLLETALTRSTWEHSHVFLALLKVPESISLRGLGTLHACFFSQSGLSCNKRDQVGFFNVFTRSPRSERMLSLLVLYEQGRGT